MTPAQEAKAEVCKELATAWPAWWASISPSPDPWSRRRATWSSSSGRREDYEDVVSVSPVKYKQFVEALPPFVAEARTLLNKPKLHEDDQFRNWRHRLEDLLQRVSEEGYMVNCKVATRSFDRRGIDPASNSERLAAYNRHLQDTIVELETIVEHYATLGEPKRHLPALKHPEKITPGWVWNNASYSLWAWFCGLLVAAFLFGVGVARSPLYAQFEKLWHSSP